MVESLPWTLYRDGSKLVGGVLISGDTVMTIEVLLFAGARVLVGQPSVLVTLPEDASAGDLIVALAKEHRELQSLLPSCRLAIGDEYVSETCLLQPGRQCALIPPVSGG